MERNVAGQIAFVDPDDVRGTLRHGFEMTRSLETRFSRAAMLMFVLSEVHPFDDGNDRVARAFMNAELISGGQRRILIPISFRGDYLTGLRRQQPDTIRQRDRLQRTVRLVELGRNGKA